MDTGHFVCENFCQNCVFLAQLLGAQLCQADVKSKISKESSPYGLLYININQWDIFHFGIYIYIYICKISSFCFFPEGLMTSLHDLPEG